MKLSAGTSAQPNPVSGVEREPDALPSGASAAIAARLDRLPSSRTLWKIIALISLGGLFEYYDLFFTGYVAPGMAKSGLFSPDSLGFFASLAGIKVAGFGTFVFSTFAGLWLGVVLFGQLADRYGRRPVFTWSLVWYACSTVIMAFQHTGEMVNVWRFIAGVGFGVQLVTIDAYISELTPLALRGRAFSMNQFVSFCIVPVVALFAWRLVPVAPFGLDGWRWVVLIGSAGAAVAWFLIRQVPESPRWLALHGRVAEADAITTDIERRIETETGTPLPAPHVEVPEEESAGRFREIFARKYWRRTLMLSVFNMAQVIGFYGFAAWVPTLLIARGINITHSLQYSFIIAIANPFGPLVGTYFADYLERKTQIILGLIVMGVSMLGFAHATSPVVLITLGVVFTLAANIMSYAYHSYQAELYPTRIRARAVGFVYSWSRFAAAFAGLAVGYFLNLGGALAVATFIAIAMVVGITVIGVFGPSTKGIALEQISH
ncbi:MFS transporter [Dyella acidisoli]|uniref:MFS transporter n=1 Tax=Dyella acidisoli TaxID=1867834 RepID=A0ABQ5XTF0_9GAMM|nr:MFS transporter [Dyella acidisoli]GLQ93703.1 MFS transporter [Dyella acidisoli]